MPRPTKLDDRLASELAEALAYTRLLQTVSLQLIADEPVEALYERLAAAAATVMRSDFASIQILHPRHDGELLLLAHRGFSNAAAAGWMRVSRQASTSCGEALRRGERVVVPDVERCSFIAGGDALSAYRAEGIRAVQSTPLFARDGELVGMLSTHWRTVCHPSERQLMLLDILARQAADLIERRCAAVQLREAHDALEQKVVQRTAQVRELLRRLVNGQEEERRRIAREIHDEMGQQMTALRMNIELMTARPSVEQTAITQDLVNTLDRSIDFLAWELRPAAVDRLGLAEALAGLVDEWSARFAIAAECDVSVLRGIRFELDVASNVYRMVQEALHNVYKHAHAGLVVVRADRAGGEATIVVSDDGCGFDAAAALAVTATLGVTGMRERAVLIGGELILSSSPRGSTVHLRIPLP